MIPSEPKAAPSPAIRIKSWDDAYQSFEHAAFAASYGRNSVLSDIQRIETEHVGPIRSVDGPAKVELPMQVRVIEASIGADAIEEMNFDAHATLISNIVEQSVGHSEKLFLSMLESVTNAVGNVVSGPLTVDTLREVIRKVEWDFDEDGKATPKQIMVSPHDIERVKSVVEEAGRDPEIIQIMREKQAKAKAERRRRTLL